MDYLSFKSALSLLLESKKELKSLLDRGKVTQEQHDKILNSLPKKLDKYAGWIGNNINNTEASINHIVDLLNWFENNKNKIDEKDINKYTVDSLQSTFDDIGVSKSQKQKEIKGDGSKLIYEDDEYLLYEIYNHEASCYYGSGTKWCITGKNPNNRYGSSYSWDLYTEEGSSFMFLIKKNGDINDNYYKVAIAYKDKDNVRYILAAFNSLDEEINMTKLKSITKSVNNNWDYTYFENEQWYGNVPFEIMSTKDILNKTVEGTYTIQSDGTVDVNGDVNISGMYLAKMPVKFGKITGNFDCSYNKFTNLIGAPESVGGDFYCNNNQLTSLKGSPKSVEGKFDCTQNKLKTLLDGPELVNNSFFCNKNQLTNLEGAPKSVGGDFGCNVNQLTSLKGGPQSVGRSFYCNYNQLTSLEGAPKSIVNNFICYNNKLTSLVGVPQSVNGYFDCSNNQLTSLDGAPSSVGDGFRCSNNQLTSLKKSPKSVGGNFDCSNNKVKFTKDDVRAVSDVKGNIIV
jgi:RNA binding exosome subunit